MAMKKFALQVDPVDKLRFIGNPRGEIQVVMKITNKSDQRQAFKVKCTRNDIFKIRPATGIIDYGQSASVTITFKNLDGADVPEDDRHHFGIYHIPAPEGCTCDGAWAEHYGPPQGEYRIKAAFAVEKSPA